MLSKHDRWLRYQAKVWAQWEHDRKHPGFDSMSMTKRDELLDKYRERLRVKVQQTGKSILQKVDKSELRALVEQSDVPVTRVHSGGAIDRMVRAFEESFLEKE